MDLQYLQNWLIAKQAYFECLKDRIQDGRVKAKNSDSYTRTIGSSKCLAVEIDEILTWDSHVTSVSKKASSGIGVLKND